MSLFYHGSPYLFDRFDLSNAGEGTGIKFGFGVYLTEVEASAVHYSEPRQKGVKKQDMVPHEHHYLYTIEIPDLTEDNHITSAVPVPQSIVEKVEGKLGVKAPAKVVAKGKEFRKWVGMTLTSGKKAGFAEEKAAAQLLDSIGVLYNVWPQSQSNPDGPRNVAVFNEGNIRIIKTEEINITLKGEKWILTSRRQLTR